MASLDKAMLKYCSADDTIMSAPIEIKLRWYAGHVAADYEGELWSEFTID
jgi:hypothetical protein